MVKEEDLILKLDHFTEEASIHNQTNLLCDILLQNVPGTSTLPVFYLQLPEAQTMSYNQRRLLVFNPSELLWCDESCLRVSYSSLNLTT